MECTVVVLMYLFDSLSASDTVPDLRKNETPFCWIFVRNVSRLSVSHALYVQETSTTVYFRI